MSKDEAHLFIFMILYILYIIYLIYMQNMSVVKGDWTNYKCNPLFLFIDSINSTPEESTQNFKNCIKSVR
jgi:hypothetical protein